DVMRVMIRRIKIGIIADAHRQFHRHIPLRMKHFFPQARVIAQCWCIRREQVLKNLARLPPRWSPEREKWIKRILREYSLVVKFRRSKMTKLFQCGQINNQVPECYTHTRFPSLRFENTERKIL